MSIMKWLFFLRLPLMQRRLRRSVRWWTSFHRRLGGWWDGEDGAEHFNISKIKGWYLPGGDQWPHLTAAKWRREERGGWRLFSEPQPRLRHLGGDGSLVHWTKQSACSKLQPDCSPPCCMQEQQVERGPFVTNAMGIFCICVEFLKVIECWQV